MTSLYVGDKMPVASLDTMSNSLAHAQYGQTWHLSTQLRSGERTVVLWSASVVNHTIVPDPTIPRPGFDLPRHTWSLMNHFRTGQGPCRAKLHKRGLAQSPSCDCGQQPHQPHCRHVPVNKIWRRTEFTPRSGWWRSHMAGIYSDFSTREIKLSCDCKKQHQVSLIQLAVRHGMRELHQIGLLIIIFSNRDIQSLHSVIVQS